MMKSPGCSPASAAGDLLSTTATYCRDGTEADGRNGPPVIARIKTMKGYLSVSIVT